MLKLFYCSLLCFLSLFSQAQNIEIQHFNINKSISMRGLSVVNDRVAWVSGNQGQVGITKDSGETWQWVSPKGFEKLDFRDIEAFDDQRAVIINAGSPAYILKTNDGGLSWKQVYYNTDSLIFLDGMDFWDDQKGIIFGDPIKNKMPLLRTIDGGESWQDISSQLPFDLMAGEAGFAASGTSIRTLKNGKVMIGTGGLKSHIYFSNNYGKSWVKYPHPIWQGESSTGIFSLAFADAKYGIAVGGNYLKDQDNSNNIWITKNAGKTWIKPISPILGYRSAIEYIGKRVWIAVGSSGIDYSTDHGFTWTSLNKLNYNTVRKAKKGQLILLTGPKGVISKISLN